MTQISSVHEALRGVGRELMRNHLRHCATSAIRGGDQAAADATDEELVEMMRRYKRYPRVALDNNWEGTVVLKMVIGANGMIASLSVVSSTGHEVLDKQAIDMIQKAKGRVPIPSALRGRAYPVEVPVIFSTKDQGSG
jgi:protein TonB